MAAGTELPSWAQTNAPRRGVPLQFSGRADATNTFLESGEAKEELESLSDGLFGVGKQVAPRGSMQGLPPTLRVRRNVPSRETRELLDRRRNWMLASPESLPGGPNASDPSTSLEELQKAGKLTAVEQYYLEMSRQQSNASKSTEQAGVDGMRKEGDNSKLPDNIREREEELKRLLTTEMDRPAELDVDFTGSLTRARANTGSRSAATPLPTPTVTRKESSVEQYRQMLGLPSTFVEVADIFKSPGTLPERDSSLRIPSTQTPAQRPVLPAPVWSPAAAQQGLAPSAPTVAEIPRVIAPLGAATVPLKPELPQRSPPPPPTFTAPRRLF